MKPAAFHPLRRCLCLLLLLGCLAGCRAPAAAPESSVPLPPAAGDAQAAGSSEELRGVWLSYLELEPLLQDADPAAAEARLTAVMDTCAAAGINTVFFHARAHSDAFYASAVYPPAAAAAALLQQGFDPLACAVEAAHARGLSLHAWVNPYRIGEDSSRAATQAENAVFCQEGIWYYNPGCPAARQLVLDGVRELLQNYAIDGIHFDDYFYPARLRATGETFEAIPAGTDVGDWRRNQVDGLISAVYGLVHQSGRVFGVSPIALPEKCRTTAYADVAAWMRQPGYIDYICPQIYFGFENTASPFAGNLAMWAALPRRTGVRLYIGLALYKAGLPNDPYAGGGQAEWAQHSDILARQVAALRAGGQANGFVLFRYAQLAAPDAAAAAELQNLLPLMQDE